MISLSEYYLYFPTGASFSAASEPGGSINTPASHDQQAPPICPEHGSRVDQHVAWPDGRAARVCRSCATRWKWLAPNPEFDRAFEQALVTLGLLRDGIPAEGPVRGTVHPSLIFGRFGSVVWCFS